MSDSSSAEIRRITTLLRQRYGTIPWWPGTRDEVIIGAILTQQTRWENVERALEVMRERGIATIPAVHAASSGSIEDAIRCTGFYRVKARRLVHLADHIMETYGGTPGMVPVPTPALRQGLLSVHGIGEETADSILCYALDRPSFVVDAYTDRICRCLGLGIPRKGLKKSFEDVLPQDNQEMRQAHAHIVEFAKEFCGKRRCSECILKSSDG